MDLVDLELGIYKNEENIVWNDRNSEEVKNFDKPLEDKRDCLIKFQILQRLVQQLQSRWRGGKVRETVLPMMEKMREDKRREEQFLAILYEDSDKGIERRDENHNLNYEPPLGSECYQDRNSEPPHRSEYYQEEDIQYDESHMDDHQNIECSEEQTEIPIVDELTNQISSTNEIKNSIRKFCCQRVLTRLLAQHLVNRINLKDEEIAASEHSEFEVESVDVLIPGNNEGPWMVEEVTDLEQYELQFERLRFAATKIQRYMRRFLTRQKFLAYMNDKSLDTAWAEREELKEIAENNGEKTPDMQEVMNNDTINTEGCPVM